MRTDSMQAGRETPPSAPTRTEIVDTYEEAELDLREVVDPVDDMFDDRNLDYIRELGEDIARNGLLSAPLVWLRPDGQYEMVAGQNRKMACVCIGKPRQRCRIIRGDLAPTKLTLLRYAENKLHKGVNATQEAAIFISLMRQNGWSQAELARQTGQKPSWVNKVLKPFLVFDEERRTKIGKAAGQCPVTTAAVLARHPAPDERDRLFDKAVAGLLVRESAIQKVQVALGRGKKERKPKKVRVETPGGVKVESPLDVALLLNECIKLAKACRKVIRLKLGPESLNGLLKA